jgi:NADP-dependent 3-hydroxy acid dehydrogenase YdfG
VRWLWAQLAGKNIMESCCSTKLVLLICEVQLWSDSVVLLLQVADVGDYAAIRRVIEEAFAWRPIDVLICNAGLLRTAYFEDLKLQDINDLMQTNVMGSVYPVHAALPSLKQRSRTHPICIVFVASLASLVKKQKSDHNTCLVTQTNFKTRHSRERHECNSAAVQVHMPISHTCL